MGFETRIGEGRAHLPLAIIVVDAVVDAVVVAVLFEDLVLPGPVQEGEEVIEFRPVVEGLGELAVLARYHVLRRRG